MISRTIDKRIILTALASLLFLALSTGCSGNEKIHAGHDHGKAYTADAEHTSNTHEDPGRSADPHSSAPHSHEADHTGHGAGGLHLSPEQKERMDLRLARVQEGSIHKRISFPGEIILDQDSFIHLVPRISGVVTEVRVTKGDKVSRGQILAVLESPEIGRLKASFLDACQEHLYSKAEQERFIEIKKNTDNLIELLDSEPAMDEINQDRFGDMADYGSRLISSYAGYSVSKKAFERRQALYEKRISSEKDFLAVRGEYEASRAAYLAELANIRFSLEQEVLIKEKSHQASGFTRKAAASQLRTMGMTTEEIEALAASIETQPAGTNSLELTKVNLRAPRGGTILERLAGTGKKAEADTTLFTLADLEHVWAILKAPARDLPHVKNGHKVEITSESGMSAAGTVKVVDPLVSEDTRTSDIRVVLDNRSGAWKPGLFVRGFIDLPETDSRLVIPREAVQNINGENFVFVPQGETFITAPVNPGRSDNTSVEILSGLQPGMEYVAEGAFQLKAMIVTGSLDPHAGHGH